MRQQYEPKTYEQRVGYLIEECGEVLAAAGKLLRWGRASQNPELRPGDPLYGETNEAWLQREMDDLRGAIDRMEVAIECPWALRTSQETRE